MKKTLEQINKIIVPNNENRISRAYDILMLIAIIVGVFPLMFREKNEYFWYFDIISCLCFIVDYILRWITCGLRSKKNNWTTYITYPFTPMAIIDLLSILPIFNLLGPTFKVFRVSRLLIILRIFKIIRYFEPLQIIMAVIRRQSSILLTVLSLALFYIYITALIMFNAEEQINPVDGQVLFEDFFDAFYWAACTLTTVGYGDLYPISDTGRIISIISSVVGIAIIALPSGIVTAGYMNELKQRRNLNDKNCPSSSKTGTVETDIVSPNG